MVFVLRFQCIPCHSVLAVLSPDDNWFLTNALVVTFAGAGVKEKVVNTLVPLYGGVASHSRCRDFVDRFSTAV